ncbi:GNAT family N-acetyltransferase [Intrasporangium mesophilum]
MPPTPVTFTLLTDPHEAKRTVAPLVERDPESMSVLSSVTEGLLSDPTRYVGPRWWVARDAAGDVVAAFMHTPPHPLHIAVSTPDQARGLAELLAGEGESVHGASGLREPVEAFASEWVRLTGTTATVEMEVGRFNLPERPSLPFEVAGRFRLATPHDATVVDAWSQDFVDTIEGTTVATGGRVVNSLDQHVAAGLVGIWEVDGTPASMAYASPTSGGVTRISGVWTPVELRGNGYASGVVHALSAARMDAGARCILYTDLANPTSNAIYQAMGYRRDGDNVSIRFA